MNFDEKLKKIRLVLTDVDGVLTDGGMIYSSEGLAMKRFNVKDGMGSELLKTAGFLVGILTTDKTNISKKRAEVLKLDVAIIGERNKLLALHNIMNEKNLLSENIAFIGDDVNDIEILQAVGFSACPSDAHPKIKEIVDYVTNAKGGEGVFREVADLILNANGNYPEFSKKW